MNKNITYFEWLIKRASLYNDGYKHLYRYLFKVPFHYSIALDDNRAADAFHLRYLFDDDTGKVAELELGIDNDSVSVFEVLIAIIDRLSYSSGLDCQASYWMHLFLHNLFIDTFKGNFDVSKNKEYIDYSLSIWMNHQYRPDGGEGGLFYVPGTKRDLRKMDLFSQWTEYINSEKPLDWQ